MSPVTVGTASVIFTPSNIVGVSCMVAGIIILWFAYRNYKMDKK